MSKPVSELSNEELADQFTVDLNEQPAKCLACESDLYSAYILVCADCLGEGCQLFIKLAEELDNE